MTILLRRPRPVKPDAAPDRLLRWAALLERTGGAAGAIAAAAIRAAADDYRHVATGSGAIDAAEYFDRIDLVRRMEAESTRHAGYAAGWADRSAAAPYGRSL